MHRFHITAPPSGDPVAVTYNSRRTVDLVIEGIRQNGRFTDFSFGQKRDPCESFFQKVTSVFRPAPSIRSLPPGGRNIGVALTPDMPGMKPPTPPAASHTSGISTLTTRTDNAQYARLDPATLEPLGACDQTTLHPALSGQLSATHAKTDPATGDVFNFNLALGRTGTYRVWQARAATGETSILATLDAPAAYLHSLLLTEHAVVLCVWNARFARGGLGMLWTRNMLDALADLDPAQPAKWFVVDRTAARRGVLATYESPAFFCFHTINAYEEPSTTDEGKVDIVADLTAYEDLSVIKRFYYNNLVSSSPDVEMFHERKPKCQPRYARYRLPSVPLSTSTTGSSSPPSTPSPTPRPATREALAPPLATVELPTLHPARHTRRHRYVYGVLDTGRSSFVDGLGKLDVQSLETVSWSQRGHTAGEPIFVADPEGKEEDDGVLLSVVLDGEMERSYLLCLDARTMREVGRAWVGGVVGLGFHGVHVPEGRRGQRGGGQ